MSRVLAVDTSTDMTTLALVDSGQVIGSADHTDARGHAEAIGMLFASIPELDVTTPGFTTPDLVVCGVGPGPFTGLRVGIAFGETLGWAWGIPVVGVCSLDAVAHHIVRTSAPGTEFIAATDARRGEYYWARYDSAGQRLEGPQVSKREVVDSGGTVVFSGVHPLAVDLAACLDTSAHLPLTPLYLRAPDAQPSTPAGAP